MKSVDKHEEREIVPGVRMSQPGSVWAEAARRNAAYLGVSPEEPVSPAAENVPVEEVASEGTVPDPGVSAPTGEFLLVSRDENGVELYRRVDGEEITYTPLSASVTTADLPQTGAGDADAAAVATSGQNEQITEVDSDAGSMVDNATPPPAIQAPSAVQPVESTDAASE